MAGSVPDQSPPAWLKIILPALFSPAVVVDRSLRLVAVNPAFQDLAGSAEDSAPLLGLTFGEALGCDGSLLGGRCCREGGEEQPPVCDECGTEDTIQRAFSVGSARGLASMLGFAQGLHPREFRLQARRFEAGPGEFVLCVLEDLASERQREMLERVVFEEVAPPLRRIAHLAGNLGAGSPESTAALQTAAQEALQALEEQEDLAALEVEAIPCRPSTFPAARLLHELAEIYRGHPLARDRTLHVTPPSGDDTVTTDPLLVQRAFRQILRNAIEASQPGESIFLGVETGASRVALWCHNRAVIAPEVQQRLFQRSVSTKGPGRGHGTYVLQMLATRYLQAKVEFYSSPQRGTVFTLSLPRNPDAGQIRH